jgi:BASS family bile acid:Na+ symporter
VVIGATLVGYLPELDDGELWKAVAVGLVVLALALFLGYTMGDGRDNLKEVGGLASAQRGTAAALIVATQNFDDARVLIVITILNTLGIVLLIGAAKAMARENSLAPLPAVADPPPGRDHYGRPATA